MKFKYGALVGWYEGENQNIQKKYVPVPLCSPRSLQRIIWIIRGPQSENMVTAWTVVQPLYMLMAFTPPLQNDYACRMTSMILNFQENTCTKHI